MQTWDYPSKSSPGTVYTVTHGDGGVLACTCRGWTMKKGDKPRECTHIKDVIAKEKFTREVRGDYVFGIVPSTTGVGAWDEDEEDENISLTSGSNGRIIVLSREDDTPEEMMTMTTMTPEQTAIGGMKASGMVSGRFGHVLDADGYVIPEKFDLAFNTGLWVMDQKIDGHRCIVFKQGDSVTTTLQSIPSLPKHIVDAMLPMPDGIYDGELFVNIPGSVSTDVPNLKYRGDLVYGMFDVLEVAGMSTVDMTQLERRAMLELSAGHSPNQTAAVVVAQWDTPSWDVVKGIFANKGEGVILKLKTAKYKSGYRTGEWIKVKTLEHHTVEVTGFEKGELGPTGVVLFKFDDGTAGRCKNLNNEELRQTAANPDAFIGRRLVVQMAQRTRGGRARHPMFDHWAGDGE